MKKNIFWMVVLTICLVGCKDNAEVRSAVGTYSYKSTAMLQIDSLLPVTLIEQGTMEIVSLKDQDSVLFTFNELLGGTYSTHASIKGNDIVLCPFTRSLSYALRISPITIFVQGSGHVYDNTVVLNLNYHNQAEDSLCISAPDVLVTAKKNK